MKILLPVCGTDDTKLIIDFLSNYHWPPRVAFKVLHVLGTSGTEADLAEAERSAREMLDKIVARLKMIRPSAQVISSIVPGSAILEIVTTASKWRADMIVMGYRSRNDIESMMAGSVSKAVAVQAPCSVAIIRPPDLATPSARAGASGQTVHQSSN